MPTDAKCKARLDALIYMIKGVFENMAPYLVCPPAFTEELIKFLNNDKNFVEFIVKLSENVGNPKKLCNILYSLLYDFGNMIFGDFNPCIDKFYEKIFPIVPQFMKYIEGEKETEKILESSIV